MDPLAIDHNKIWAVCFGLSYPRMKPARRESQSLFGRAILNAALPIDQSPAVVCGTMQKFGCVVLQIM